MLKSKLAEGHTIKFTHPCAVCSKPEFSIFVFINRIDGITFVQAFYRYIFMFCTAFLFPWSAAF